jgi:hypothetical protein
VKGAVTKPIFTKLDFTQQRFVNDFCAEFCEISTDRLVETKKKKN